MSLKSSQNKKDGTRVGANAQPFSTMNFKVHIQFTRPGATLTSLTFFGILIPVRRKTSAFWLEVRKSEKQFQFLFSYLPVRCDTLDSEPSSFWETKDC